MEKKPMKKVIPGINLKHPSERQAMIDGGPSSGRYPEGSGGGEKEKNGLHQWANHKLGIQLI